MKYNSVPEYFYKLYNRLYALILMPLLVFVILYWQMQTGSIEGVLQDNEQDELLVLVFTVAVLIDWITSFFLFRSSLKTILTLGSLGDRLDKYYQFTLVRFGLIVAGLLVLAAGFYLTENQYFTILFVASILALALFWPTSSKVCEDLQLKGDERKLILFKMEKLH